MLLDYTKINTMSIANLMGRKGMFITFGDVVLSVQSSPNHYCVPGKSVEIAIMWKDRWNSNKYQFSQKVAKPNDLGLGNDPVLGTMFEYDDVEGWVTAEQLEHIITVLSNRAMQIEERI